MTCPHQTILSPLSIRCALIDQQVAGPTNPNFPCVDCQREWKGGRPPTADELTPTLMAIVQIDYPPAWDISQPSRGAGDTAAKLLHRLGIRKRRGCGCGRRQTWWNRVLPYR